MHSSAPHAELKQLHDLTPTPENCRYLGNAGGFSGAMFWRLATGQRKWCVRAWPVSTKAERLDYIHRHLMAIQLPFIPHPQLNSSGGTYFSWQGRLVDVTPWMPGVANFHQRPSAARLTSAFGSLRRLHHALEQQQPESHPQPVPESLLD